MSDVRKAGHQHSIAERYCVPLKETQSLFGFVCEKSLNAQNLMTSRSRIRIILTEFLSGEYGSQTFLCESGSPDSKIFPEVENFLSEIECCKRKHNTHAWLSLRTQNSTFRNFENTINLNDEHNFSNLLHCQTFVL